MASARWSSSRHTCFGSHLARAARGDALPPRIILSFLYRTPTIARHYATEIDEPTERGERNDAAHNSTETFQPFRGPPKHVLEAEPNTGFVPATEEHKQSSSWKAPYPLARNRGRRSGPQDHFQRNTYGDGSRPQDKPRRNNFRHGGPEPKDDYRRKSMRQGGSGNYRREHRTGGIVDSIDRAQGFGRGRGRTVGTPRKVNIPFEGLDANEYNALEQSTISVREYQTFEKLFATGMENGTFSGTGLTLDAILDQAVQKEKAATDVTVRPINAAPKEMTGVRNTEIGPAMGPAANDVPVRLVVTETLRQKAKELQKYRDAIDKAQSDAELWQFLQEIFATVKALELDDPVASATRDRQRAKAEAASQKTPKQPTRQIARVLPPSPVEEVDLHKWSTNFPLIINHVVKTFDRSFTGSPFAALVLPALKSLGPSEFTFGASTALFNSHMNLLSRQGDLEGITRVLEEMDRQVHPFDEATFGLLNRILRHSQGALRGDFGPGQKLLWSMEHKTRSVKGIHGWAARVREHIQEDALRRSREKDAAAMADGLIDGATDGPGLSASDTLSTTPYGRATTIPH